MLSTHAMKWLCNFLIYTSVGIVNFLCAQTGCRSYTDAVFLGPEIYYVNRTREGGAQQDGVIYGVRAGYDHVRRYKLYWGIEGLGAKGVLKGKHAEYGHLYSDWMDANIEGRFGYTFQSKCRPCASFVPFVGLGYSWENNHYKYPSPLKLHFDNTFAYVPVGFLSQIFVTPTFSIGLNFKIRILVDGKQKVSHDPDNDRATLRYGEKPQYRVELPLSYFFYWKDYRLALSLDPFYEYRHYGHSANFPFDFLETKLNLYGATLKLFYLF
jgi:hypothetical protein